MRARREHGFVLVLVLMVLVALALLAAAVAASGARAVAAAQEEIDRLDGDLDMASTRETLQYMLATNRINLAGLSVVQAPALTPAQVEDDADGTQALPVGGEIRLDASPYRGLGNADFAIQDDAGLLSPNWAAPTMLAGFFSAHGAQPSDWAALEAKRLDYQDADTLHRLNGAEADEYERAGRPPPANRTLATPLEFRRILQWDDLLKGMDDSELLGTLSVGRHASINVNTAPEQVLALLPGMDREQARRMIALRRQAPFTSPWKIRDFFTISPDSEDLIGLFANRSANLILWDRRFGGRRLVHWTSTPFDLGGIPWRTDYEVSLPRDQNSDQSVAEAPASPLLTPKGAGGPGGEPAAGGGERGNAGVPGLP